MIGFFNSFVVVLAVLGNCVDAESVSYRGVDHGGSSFLHFDASVRRHVSNLANSLVHHDNEHLNPKTVLDGFWREHASYFGVQPSEMVLKKVMPDPTGKIFHYHFDQIIDGFKVYGGDVVVSLSSLNEVMSANGNALPTATVNRNTPHPEDAQKGAYLALQRITEYLNEEYPSKDKYVCKEVQKGVDGGVRLSVEWFRSGLTTARQGATSLAYRTEGQCSTSTSSDFKAFNAFVDVNSGNILQFVDTTSKLMTQRTLSKPSSEGTSTANLRKTTESVKAVHSPSVSRKLDYAADVDMLVYDDYNSGGGCCYGQLLYNEDTDPLPTDNEILMSVDYSIGITRMMRSLSNQQWKSYKEIAVTLKGSVHYPDFNAYYNGYSITVGQGLAVDDVLAHEWAHGYTDYSSNLEYAYLSGALNEAMSDIFGEAYDILNRNNQPLTEVLRTADPPTCTSYNWIYRTMSGTDNSHRWLMGEEITQSTNPGGLYAIRDMYKPECFGNPGTTYSNKFYCGTGDGGGVHYNSGVANRLFAVLVDGGVYEHPGDGSPIVVNAIGMTKALNLMWATQLNMASTSQFKDFAAILKSQCFVKIGGALYEPDVESGSSQLAGYSLTMDDCTQVENAIAGAGLMRTRDEICATPPTLSPTARPDGLSCDVENSNWVGDGWCDKSDGYNTAGCDWDGGDCCEETCVDGPQPCGINGYDCVDPKYSEGTKSPTPAPVPVNSPAPTARPDGFYCNVSQPEYVGDGWCDKNGGYNSAGCDWDGGDCCEDTCSPNATYPCGIVGYDCKDPDSTLTNAPTPAPVVTPSPTMAPNGLTCDVASPSWLGDGLCDMSGGYNTEECGWDGGDCCADTCVGTNCGIWGYQCLDPNSSSPKEPTSMPVVAAPTSAPVTAAPTSVGSCAVYNADYIGDGWCDKTGGYNTVECGWDGGDCCEASCNSTVYACGITGYECLDPAYTIPTLAPTLAPATSKFPTSASCVVPYPNYIGDGWCDSSSTYNNANCNWDGGDCCPDTCVSSSWTCGNHGYYCLNPASPYSAGAPTVSPTFFISGPGGVCNVETPSYVGDGWCDKTGGYNTPECGFDGGDCCEESCQDGDSSCGVVGYDCVDPLFANENTFLCDLIANSNVGQFSPQWRCNGGKPVTQPCGNHSWVGLKCNSDGHVTHMDLKFVSAQHHKVLGKIPESVGQMRHLIGMNFAHQDFRGQLPREFGKLKKLKFLKLNDNKIHGIIPVEFGDMHNIKLLHLARNWLDGPVPLSFKQLYYRNAYVHLDGNRLKVENLRIMDAME